MNRTTIVVGTIVVILVIGFAVALRGTPTTLEAPPVVVTHAAPVEAPAKPSIDAADVSGPHAVAASRPPAPMRRLATDRDLFATYRELKRSNAGGDLHVARSILYACYLSSQPHAAAREVAAGHPPMSKMPLPARAQIDAANDLLSRCRGFAGMTKLEVQQAVADMAGRLARADDPVGWGESILRQRRGLSDDQLRAILASQDPIAIAFISADLAGRWRKRTQPVAVEDEDTQSARSMENDLYFTLASCNLGLPCESDSFGMREKCVYHVADCDIDFRDYMMAGISPDDRPEVYQQVGLFVDAIRNNDFAFWGL